MILFKSITIKNFMSVGNITQAINFHDAGLTLVLGNNLDLGGDSNKNGTGKTTMINALSYALYGNAISNIKRNNLINKTNNKNMLVTMDFEINGTKYRIERGRSPNVLRFLVNDIDAIEETDEGQGEGRLTQAEIERVIGMNHLMFKHLVALNTYNEPFLSLKANDQREIIENLLGITLLSEKANVLREQIKVTRDNIKEEEYRIKGIENANEQIGKSIDDLRRRQRIWRQKTNQEIIDLNEKINIFANLDIQAELAQHELLVKYLDQQKELQDLNKAVDSFNSELQREMRNVAKIQNEIDAVNDHKCYACGQDLHDQDNQQVLAEKNLHLTEAKNNVIAIEAAIADINTALAGIIIITEKPVTKYNTISEAYSHQNQLTALNNQLSHTQEKEDPYADQIKMLEETGIKPITWDAMNQLHDLREHQDFLLKLLTNKDSFIRKRIIEQNLQHLNTRLNYYLVRLGLPHEVVFLSDLTLEITELGRDLDFDNLSRGERNRLILGLSWAFRDVHESTNMPIDFMAIDELIDSGLDQSGVEAALHVLKSMYRERNKNIFLISHREELIGRIDNVLHVVKENGFTSFNTNQEFENEHI